MRSFLIRFIPVLLTGGTLILWKYLPAADNPLTEELQTALLVVLALCLVKSLSPDMRHIPDA